MNPPKRITDPTFQYTRSDFTDVRATFARVRQQMRQKQRTQQSPSYNVQAVGNFLTKKGA